MAARRSLNKAANPKNQITNKFTTFIAIAIRLGSPMFQHGVLKKQHIAPQRGAAMYNLKPGDNKI